METHETRETNRGRVEIRQIAVYEPNTAIFSEWYRLAKVVTVRRKTVRNGKAYESIHYYITSLSNTPVEKLLSIIRSHWGIENKLHWVKDVILHEDSTKCYNNKRTKINSWFRNVLINLFRLNKIDSIKKAMELYANRPRLAYELMRI